MHDYLVPPEDTGGVNLEAVEWRTEYDVLTALRGMGHDVRPVPIADELKAIRAAIGDWKPHIAFNMLEAFDEIASFDQNIVSFLELSRMPYTGCNPRGLILARDKALSKMLMAYHRIPIPDFGVFRRGRAIRRPARLQFPLIVKSLSQEASIGIAQASVVASDAKLSERVKFVHESVGTDAIAERYIEGRELYVGVMGNLALEVLPVWEMMFEKLPEEAWPIATERVKWSREYQTRHRIDTRAAADLPDRVAQQIQRVARRVYRTLELSGYARIDLRLDADGRVYVLEANPNPHIARDEDFAQSAKAAGVPYDALLQRIINLGLRWQPSRSG
ncbi:MAG: D-alanine--D-alanine ligase [Acidobacteria bacterium]|nr:D-alanine--D-alanine ligase [Acidobacteriota bacterium]